MPTQHVLTAGRSLHNPDDTMHTKTTFTEGWKSVRSNTLWCSEITATSTSLWYAWPLYGHSVALRVHSSRTLGELPHRQTAAPATTHSCIFIISGKHRPHVHMHIHHQWHGISQGL